MNNMFLNTICPSKMFVREDTTVPTKSFDNPK